MCYCFIWIYTLGAVSRVNPVRPIRQNFQMFSSSTYFPMTACYCQCQLLSKRIKTLDWKYLVQVDMAFPKTHLKNETASDSLLRLKQIFNRTRISIAYLERDRHLLGLAPAVCHFLNIGCRVFGWLCNDCSLKPGHTCFTITSLHNGYSNKTIAPY